MYAIIFQIIRRSTIMTFSLNGTGLIKPNTIWDKRSYTNLYGYDIF